MFKIEENDGVLLIRPPAIIDSKSVEPLEVEIKSWALMPASAFVLDLRAVGSFAPVAYRPFIIFKQTLKALKKHFFVINSSGRLQNQFKTDGVSGIFTAVSSLDEARRRARESTDHPVLDVALINPFVTGTVKVLETQAGIKTIPGKPFLKKPGSLPPIEIAGHLGLSCSDFKGSITLCFNSTVFLRIYEKMVGEVHTEISPEVQDAAGEIVNIIFGHAKTVLNDQQKFDLEKALPTILVGEKLKIQHSSRSPAVILPFESDVGPFHIEILIDRG